MSNPVSFARQTLIFLVMQTADASINMRLKRNWFWPLAKYYRAKVKATCVYSTGQCIYRKSCQNV